ncbi:MAG: hypothetical protein P4L57_06310 [Rhizomicrobium sp.]|nr:hypothetical protein [Rhizomicrobium sp.]
MRSFVILLGCAVALSAAALADQPFYRVDFRFSNRAANDQVFRRDRSQCLNATSMRYQISRAQNIRFGSASVLGCPGATTEPRPSYEAHATAFYQCMMAKRYRSDPNGRYAVSLSSQF